MAAFPYQNSTFVCDSLVLGNSSSLDEAETSPPQFLQKFHEEKSKSETSSVKGTLLHRKRMSKDESSQDTKGKQRKCRARKEERVKLVEEAPTGYIHVRARRGQATDSHSLAERVRREKISERMKLLQSLVPGCDKITGKALMLDEIINYVQSLQYQVELASITPVPREINALMVKSEEWSHQSLSRPLASTTFADMMETPTTTNNYSLDEEDNAVSFLQQQMLSAFSQDYQNLLWDDVHVYDDQIRRQCESSNLPSSFQ